MLETAAAARKDQRTRHPYDRRNKGRSQGRQQPARREYNRPPKHKFVMGLADLIAIPNISARLKVPEKVGDKVLGSKPDAWCEFHQCFGYTLDSCLSLGYQLDDLVKSGFLNDYLLDKRTGERRVPSQWVEKPSNTRCLSTGKSTPLQEASQVVDAPHRRGRSTRGR